MATRAPSLARRTAMPRPMPRLPPVISATRLRRDIPLLKGCAGKHASITQVTQSPGAIRGESTNIGFNVGKRDAIREVDHRSAHREGSHLARARRPAYVEAAGLWVKRR